MKHSPDIAFEGSGPDKIGADPRTLSPEQLSSLGHKPKPKLRILRAKCLDCCVGSAPEVRRCVSTDCDLWPYRMGTDPFRAKRETTPSQLENLKKGQNQ
jgi:hypothetical protein